MILIISTIVAIAFVIGFYFLGVPWWGLILLFIGGYVLTIILFLLSAGVVALTCGKKERVLLPKKIFTKYIELACSFLVFLFRIKIIYEGEELLQNLQGYEFVCNHQANFDPIIVIHKLNRKDISFVMKIEIMRIVLIGRFLYGAGYYPLDRKNNREGLKTILQSAKAIETGRPIGIYPEGTRSKGPNLNEFHDGAFKMAYRAKKDIVVSIIDNTYNIHKRYPFRNTTVLFKICEVIKYEDFKDMSTKDLDVLVRKIMLDNLNDCRQKYDKLNH